MSFRSASAPRFLCRIVAVLVAITASAAVAAPTVVPAAAPHGARVLIVGAGFDSGNAAITFAGAGGSPVAAPILGRTPQHLEVSVPLTAVTGSVRVTIDGSDAGSFNFTVLPDPPFVSVATLGASVQAHDLFKDVSGVAVTAAGTICLTDMLHHQVKILASDGHLLSAVGSGNSGLVNGPAGSAQFKQPGAVVADAAGANLYVADTGNNVIRRIAADGSVTTFAGSGATSDADGPALQASFRAPMGLAFDAAGNLLVADTGNHRIRLITPAGVVSTIAGTVHDGFADGTAMQALFKQPSGLVVGASGAIFIADSGNNRIRKIDAGQVSTVAGNGQPGLVDGSALVAQFNQPAALAIDDAGNLFVADSSNHAIRKITLSASGAAVSTLSGNGSLGYIDGALNVARFKQPAGIDFKGALFVGDSGNDALRIIYPGVTLSALYPRSGSPAGATVVRLFGTGFVAGATRVTFGDVAATDVTFVAATELIVTAPPHAAGTVDVAVTTPAGTGTLSNAFTYLPPPTLTSIDPRKGRTAGGDAVAIVGTNFFAGETAVSIGGAASSSVAVNSPSSISAVTPPHLAGPADVTVTTPSGSATLQSAFTFFAPPTIVSFSPTSGRAGDTVTVTGTNFDPDPSGDRVSVGGLAATVRSASSTALSIAVPQNASSGPISITTAGGTATSSSTFTVITYLSLTISPATVALAPGQTLQLTLTAALAGGSTADVTAQATWASGDPSIATVNAGLVRAVANGSTTISGAIGGLQATVTVNVQSAAAGTLRVEPRRYTLAVGETQPFSVFLTQPDGAETNVTASATWTSGTVAVATISSSGVLIGITAGTATISAVYGGQTAISHVQVVVLPRPAAEVAPPLDATVSYDFADANTFLYTGPDAIQQGVAEGTIVATRSAVLHGSVKRRDGQPASAVSVSISGHPEYGQTMSHADGSYDIVVNGGQPLTVRFARDGYVPASRLVVTQNHTDVRVPDLILLPYDTAVTSVDFSATAITVARGTVSSDSSGSRRATLLFKPGTSASIKTSAGLAPAAALHIRATEYTIGNDPAVMPAELPATSAYTYCVELSADEADDVDGSVVFTAPVPVYVDNFLRFPVGHVVPLGYYDRSLNMWIGQPNGITLKIVSVSAGKTDLDVTGDGNADDVTTLGIDDAERQKLAEIYSPGQSLWRFTTTHFSPIDPNSGAIPVVPTGAAAPSQPFPTGFLPQGDTCREPGHSIIDCHNQALIEAVPVAGTPFELQYDSERVGRAQYTMTVNVTGATVASPLKRAKLSIRVAGREFDFTYAPAPNIRQEFTWDGKDAFGRRVPGVSQATARVTYYYDGYYQDVPCCDRTVSFLTTSLQAILDVPSRLEIPMSQEWTYTLGHMDIRDVGFGGWMFSPQQVYDHSAGTLYAGDGNHHSDAQQTGDAILQRVAGNGSVGFGGDGGPATAATIQSPRQLAVAPDGAVYFIDQNRIRRVDAATGLITTIAGNGNFGENFDGHIATSAPVVADDIAIGPDGLVYFVDDVERSVRKIDSTGRLQTVAGCGSVSFLCPNVSEGPALKFSGRPHNIAFGSEGELYVSTDTPETIRVIRNGFEQTFVDASRVTSPGPLAVSPDGLLYVYDLRKGMIFRIRSDGQAELVAGARSNVALTDGMRATDGTLGNIISIAAVGYGTVLTAEGWSVGPPRVRAIRPDGIVSTLAGTGIRFTRSTDALTAGDRFARATNLGGVNGVAVGPDGSVYFSDNGQEMVIRTARLFPPTKGDAVLIPSADGQTGAVFSQGRHVRTVAAATGTTLYTFEYGAGGLSAVVDLDGQRTSIERNAGGAPVAIVAPGGQRTTLAITDGLLTSIANPADKTVHMAYNGDGLMQTFTDARGGLHTFTFDKGLLTKDADPAGGFVTLSRSGDSFDLTVTKTTAEGRSTAFGRKVTVSGTRTDAVVNSAGLTTSTTRGNDGTFSMRYSDGTRVAASFEPDPRFGSAALYPKTITTTLQSGALTLTRQKSVVLSNPLDPLSTTSITETFKIGTGITTATFTNASRTGTIKTPMSRVVAFQYDSKDRLSSLQFGGLAATAFAYDNAGRLASVSRGSRSFTMAYDSANRLESIRDSLQRTTTFKYDNADRLLKRTLPNGQQVRFAYDAPGNMVSLTPAGRPAHAFTFTPVDLPDTYTPPLSGIVHFDYNRDRQLTRITRPDGSAIALGYDGGGRLSTTTIGRGLYTYSYDGATGALQSMSDPDGGSVLYTTDGPLRLRDQWTGTVAGALTRTYDASFRKATDFVECPPPQVCDPVAYTYDNDNLLINAGSLTITRDAATGLVNATSIGAVRDSFLYNEFGELVHQESSFNGTTYFSTDYTRDSGGRISAMHNLIYGDTTSAALTYGYDDLGRLQTATTTDGSSTVTYEYDANGNRLSRSVGAVPLAASYDDEDRLVSYGDATYSYSAAGQLRFKTTPAGTTEYRYDELGNLLHVSLPDGRNVDYIIDAANRRVGKKVNGSVLKRWLYDGDRVIAEIDAFGLIASRFVYGARSNVPDFIIQGSYMYRVVSDHLGSPQLLIDVNSGAIAERLVYDEFGNVISDSSPGFQPIGFAGGVYDPDTKLVRFGMRDYDPQTGRWTAKDPVGFAGGDANLYSYVLNDPVNFTDPSGKWIGVDEVVGALVGASVNTGSYVIGQLIKYHGNVNCISGRDLAVTFGVGFVAGFFATDTFGASLAVAAGANTAQYIGIQAAHGREVTGTGLIANAAGGALGGAISFGLKTAGANTIESLARGADRYNMARNSIDNAIDAVPRTGLADYVSNADPDCGCR